MVLGRQEFVIQDTGRNDEVNAFYRVWCFVKGSDHWFCSGLLLPIFVEDINIGVSQWSTCIINGPQTDITFHNDRGGCGSKRCAQDTCLWTGWKWSLNVISRYVCKDIIRADRGILVFPDPKSHHHQASGNWSCHRYHPIRSQLVPSLGCVCSKWTEHAILGR